MVGTEIKTEFKKRKIRQLIIAVLMVPVVGCLLIVSEKSDTSLFGLNHDQIGLTALAIIGLALIISFINWRCPSCKKYIGKKINPNYCSNCGVDLQ
jgi:cell division protein FtsW (lipid II flippase)